MHFIVSWDINAEGEKWDALNAQLKECIEDYSWARQLSTFTSLGYPLRKNGKKSRKT